MVRPMLWDRCSVCPDYCSQMVGWINMPLAMEVGIVLDGDPAPPHGKGHSSLKFSAHVYCGQTIAHVSSC